LDAAARDHRARGRDQQDRARGLLLNVPPRPGPGGQQHPLRHGMAQPPRPRRGTAGLAPEGVPGRGQDGPGAVELVTTGAQLARAAEAALMQVRAAPGVRDAEVFAAENGGLSTRLSYTSHIPCNGVEEPKSTESRGIGIQIVLEGADGP